MKSLKETTAEIIESAKMMDEIVGAHESRDGKIQKSEMLDKAIKVMDTMIKAKSAEAKSQSDSEGNNNAA